jgi:hypothetical protein
MGTATGQRRRPAEGNVGTAWDPPCPRCGCEDQLESANSPPRCVGCNYRWPSAPCAVCGGRWQRVGGVTRRIWCFCAEPPMARVCYAFKWLAYWIALSYAPRAVVHPRDY